jgi:hypothetical protein
MAQYLAEEHLNSEGEPEKKYHVANRKRPRKKKAKLDVDPEDKAESGDDSNFVSISSDSESSDDSSRDDDPLTNAEVRTAHSSNYVLISSSSLPMSFLPSQSRGLAVGFKSGSVVAVALLLQKSKMVTRPTLHLTKLVQKLIQMCPPRSAVLVLRVKE